jgi:hypothetical protein
LGNRLSGCLWQSLGGNADSRMAGKADKNRIDKLSDAARALQEGHETCLSITRLTSLKSLCRDPRVARRFALYLAGLTLERLNASCPPYTAGEDWVRYKALAAGAVSAMEGCVRSPNDGDLEILRSIFRAATEVQNEYRKVGWNMVRTIHSRDLLVIEYALRCFLEPDQASEWVYRVARTYAERYDSRYGTGLIPASAPLLEDIVRFWRSRPVSWKRVG